MQIKIGRTEGTGVEIWGRYSEDVTESRLFSGKEKELLFLVSEEAGKPHRIYVGCGEKKSVDLNRLRVVFAAALKKAEECGEKDIQVFLPDIGEMDAGQAAAAATEGMLLAGYRFKGYKHQDTADEAKLTEKKIWLWTEKNEETWRAEKDKIERNVQEAISLAESINQIRPLIERAPNDLYPETLADFAVQMGKQYGFEVTVLKEKELEEAGMNGLLSVGRGTAHSPRFVIMRYHGNPGGKLFGLVGKGITCDTGGYCLKGKDSLPYIKGDMAGAAGVMGILSAAAKAGLKINLTAVVPTAENVIDGDSYKPGDVVVTMSGKTVEILNTDCEGRMILADALTYMAREEKADFLLDMATLTGLAGSMFGSLYTPVFASDDVIYEKFMEAAAEAGEDFWRMPLDKRYESYIRGDIADLKNMAGAGTITAAVFLQQFTEGKPWMHLDIAATAIQYPPVYPYAENMPSGVGIRTVYQMLKNMEE